jgi:hypothetical protein
MAARPNSGVNGAHRAPNNVQRLREEQLLTKAKFFSDGFGNNKLCLRCLQCIQRFSIHVITMDVRYKD